jgi:hypothetical protein
MKFKADSFLRDVQMHQPAAPQSTEEQRRAACMACEWLQDRAGVGPKCYNPSCGCPLSSARVNPWQNLRRCGAGKWTR